MTASSCPVLTCPPISKYHFFKYPSVRAYIGDEINGCTLPGRTTSCAGAASFGNTTETEGTDVCATTARNFAASCKRDRIPMARTAPAIATTITAITHCLHEALAGYSSGESFLAGLLISSVILFSAIFFTTVRCQLISVPCLLTAARAAR